MSNFLKTNVNFFETNVDFFGFDVQFFFRNVRNLGKYAFFWLFLSVFSVILGKFGLI